MSAEILGRHQLQAFQPAKVLTLSVHDGVRPFGGQREIDEA